MAETADAIIIGAGVHGASLAFHLAERGMRPLVLEQAVVAAGATGRSSGLVRMHYDVEAEARLAWRSHAYFSDWAASGRRRVRLHHGRLPPDGAARRGRWRCARTPPCSSGSGSRTEIVDADAVRRLLPGIAIADDQVAALEPLSGYADPTQTCRLADGRRRWRAARG